MFAILTPVDEVICNIVRSQNVPQNAPNRTLKFKNAPGS